jgi:hypothetical protein
MRHLSTCGRCGGTIEFRPGAAAGWGHLAETPRNADGHLPIPDDGYAAGPDAGDREPCAACRHDHEASDVCEARIGSGLFASDGTEVPAYCDCTGPVPAGPSLAVPDPWTDPDAAARAVPPPF